MSLCALPVLFLAKHDRSREPVDFCAALRTVALNVPNPSWNRPLKLQRHPAIQRAGNISSLQTPQRVIQGSRSKHFPQRAPSESDAGEKKTFVLKTR
jgi:hypothetical protein